MEQPSRFYLAINRAAARCRPAFWLGLTRPPAETLRSRIRPRLESLLCNAAL
jgi:hypothetical protein